VQRAAAILVSLALAIAGVAITAGTASAATIHGEVFADTNRDGVPTAGERGVAGVVVAFDVVAFARTDDRGQFTLDIPDVGTGIVWARVPDGYQPGPVWQRYTRSGKPLELALEPTDEPGSRPLVFVVAADTHIHTDQQWFGETDLAAIARDATALPTPPAFFTILGDVTGGNQDAEFDIADRALAGLGVPYVPVPGNHDWYDDGVTWLKRYGPDNYSFDIGDVHFVVWNMAMSEDEIRAYLGAELAYVDKAMTIVALTHAPPTPAVIDTLKELGVKYLLTGHAHSNRETDHDGLIELNTEPMLMGGLDFTPAGYRVVTIDDGGKLTSYHRSVVDEPYAAIVSPAPGACAGRELVAAAALDGGPLSVTARVDCGEPIAMQPAGGWTFRAPLPVLGGGPHAIAVDATSWSGKTAHVEAAVSACVTTSVVTSSGWSFPAPPLAPRWATAVGGHVVTARPAVGDGAAFVVTTDLADGGSGAVVALDAATGAIRWRAPSPVPLRAGAAYASAAIAGGAHGLVIAAQLDGVVRALDAATGAERWRVDLGDDLADAQERAVFAAPVIDGRDVLVGGKRRFAALDVATGGVEWSIDPVPGAVDSQSLASVAVAGGVVVGAFQRELGGLIARDRATGAPAWQLGDDLPIGVNATPVVAGDAVVVSNAADEVFALDALTGELRWRTQLDPRGFQWGNATVGAPAYAHGIVVVPTLYDDAVALDAASGAELWRVAAPGPSPLRTTHYRGSGQAGFAASPVIAGGIVWLASTDGTITAVELTTGRELWHTSGPPVLAGLATAGDALIVASYDGTVRALAPPPPGALVPLPPAVAAVVAQHCEPDADTRVDTSDAAHDRPSSTLLVVLAGLAVAFAIAGALLRRGRRRRR
jgi:outer membrane protein assembly factor BamB